MFEVRTGVLNKVPVPITDPPEDAVYQFIVPELAVADKSTEPDPHLEPSVVLVIVGMPIMFAVTIDRVTEAQPALVAST